ncbi:unnamed protein product [Lupinus luteus]|uniref:Uncharacterized protein n=1 Tax=Lupinus luteus TaxID=3873 RepID=A0AAV1WXX0_LUPLU
MLGILGVIFLLGCLHFVTIFIITKVALLPSIIQFFYRMITTECTVTVILMCLMTDMKLKLFVHPLAYFETETYVHPLVYFKTETYVHPLLMLFFTNMYVMDIYETCF